MPKACVLISTFNRVGTLLRCFEYLENQTFKDFEVVLVDDGSTDDTGRAVEAYSKTSFLKIHYFWQKNSGLAAGRNVSIRECTAPISIQIGDDIFASPTFVETHVRFHDQNPAETVVAIGLLKWSEDGQKVTRLMEWLSNDGFQFDFGSLLNGDSPIPFHMYGSDISFKTAYFRRHPYDEAFTSYGFEDAELGLRLARSHGLELRFVPQAVAYHLHPMSYTGSCRRWESVGESAYAFKKKSPEFREFPPQALGKRLLFKLVTLPLILPALTHVTDLLTRIWCPNPLMRPVLNLHGRVGYDRAAARESLANQAQPHGAGEHYTGSNNG